MTQAVKISIYLLIFLFAPLTGAAEDISKYLSDRVVEIEWDEMPNAVRYELEIYDGKYKRFIKTFVSKTNKFRLNVKMGRYYFRSRILDRWERYSPWTELADFLISPPPSRFVSEMPSKSEVYTDKKTGRYEMELKWEPRPAIENYQLSIADPQGNVIKQMQVRGTKAKVLLPPGQYQFKIQAILLDGTIGDASAATPPLSVIGAQILPPTFEFKRNTNEGPTVLIRSELAKAELHGDLFYRPLEGNEWIKVKEFNQMKARKLVFDSTYRPGLYYLRMFASARKMSGSEYGEIEFLIKPSEPDLLVVPRETTTAVSDREVDSARNN